MKNKEKISYLKKIIQLDKAERNKIDLENQVINAVNQLKSFSPRTPIVKQEKSSPKLKISSTSSLMALRKSSKVLSSRFVQKS